MTACLEVTLSSHLEVPGDWRVVHALLRRMIAPLSLRAAAPLSASEPAFQTVPDAPLAAHRAFIDALPRRSPPDVSGLPMGAAVLAGRSRSLRIMAALLRLFGARPSAARVHDVPELPPTHVLNDVLSTVRRRLPRTLSLDPGMPGGAGDGFDSGPRFPQALEVEVEAYNAFAERVHNDIDGLLAVVRRQVPQSPEVMALGSALGSGVVPRAWLEAAPRFLPGVDLAAWLEGVEATVGLLQVGSGGRGRVRVVCLRANYDV